MKDTRRALSLIALLLIGPALFAARTWTDQGGFTIEAEFVDFRNERVTLKPTNPSKREMRVKLAQLSEADQAYVRELVAKEERGKVFAGKYKALTKGEFVQYTYDDTLPYQIRAPKVEAGQTYPLVIFLHGKGESGDDNTRQMNHVPSKFYPKAFKDNPSFIIAPQCPKGKWWGGEYTDAVIRLTKQLIKDMPIDEDRVYITGLSMGGFGTWDSIAKEPKLFAAAIPICGGGKPDWASSIRKIPIWAFHGDADKVVVPENTRKMVRALEKADGNITYTEYPGVGHNSWSQTYKNPDIYDWLFQQNRSSQ